MKSMVQSDLFMLFIISVLNTGFSLIIPENRFNYRNRPYRTLEWEDSGRIYQCVFKVKQWKDSLPELSDFLKAVFPKKQIQSYSRDYLEKYAQESCRAEMTHWGIIVSSFLFFMWCGFYKALLMVIITVGLNMPYIIIQRYNRPRIIRMIESGKTKKDGSKELYSSYGAPVSILFISAEDTGHGHKSITHSLKHQIELLDPNANVSVVDGFSLGGRILSLCGKMYNPIASVCPRLWGILYEIGNYPVKMINAIVSLMIRDKLLKAVKEHKPDIIVSVHAVFVGSVLNVLESAGMDIPFIPFVADLDNVASLWGDERSRYTLCPSIESTQSMLYRGLMPHKLKTVGFPVREDFCEPDICCEARSLTDERASIMIVSGSQGSWHVSKMARLILDQTNCSITVVAGRNEALKKRLEAKLSSYGESRVHVHGFVTDMKTQMQKADILIIRASPNVLMEAVNLCRPVIITGALFGQEEKNPDYALRYGLGVVCRDINRLPQTVHELVADNGKMLSEISKRQYDFRNISASREIAKFILDNAQGMSVNYSSRFELGGDMAALAK